MNRDLKNKAKLDRILELLIQNKNKEANKLLHEYIVDKAKKEQNENL